MSTTNYRNYFLAILLSVLTFSSHYSEAQLFGKKKKEAAKAEAASKAKKPKGPKKIADEVKSCNEIEGLFKMYQDTLSGELKMAIREDQLDQEYIHFYYIENGVLESSAFRGQYRGERIIKINKYFNKIEFSIQNTSYYFDPEEAISKASEANIADAIVFSTEIKAGSEKEGTYLIDVDKLFLTDAFGFIKRPSGPKPNPTAFNVGRLSSSKTKYSSIRNYPENTDIIVSYVYENAEPKNTGSAAVVDARNITIKAQHSLIKVPENDFESRFDDPRVGYFTTEVTDLTSYSSTPYRDLIDRWHLVKKDPSSELSEPVEPITWWIENTTPRDIRGIIKEAGESWNIAFEKAGFKNAVVVKEQPDTATWDAGDIRYNVLRWTSSPNLAFGGYGPNFTNPKTGQVLGSDIMLEYATLGGLARIEKVFSTSNDLGFDSENDYPHSHNSCDGAIHAMAENAFGMFSLKAFDAPDEEMARMTEEYLYRLVLHEIGHTLGLNHNMMASQLHPLSDIHNMDITNEKGLTGSVMDYPAINFAKDRENQGQYYDVKPGPYDLWAIEFGYKPNLSEDELNAILNRSTEPELMFGNDADDMRAPGRGIDPRINVGDLSSDAIEYAVERVALSKEVLTELMQKYGTEEGKSYNDLRVAYLIATRQQFTGASAISRYVGGVYVDRAFVGQEGASKPLIPVEKDIQQSAMKALEKNFLAPNAFDINEDIYNYLQIQRRGFNNFSNGNEDPKIHDRLFAVHRSILDQLLNAKVLNRIVDTELYGNEYELSMMMGDLHNAIFKEDAYKAVNSFRQNLQTEYVTRLISVIESKGNAYLPAVKAMAFYNLNAALKVVSRSSSDVPTKAHRQFLTYRIEKALDD